MEKFKKIKKVFSIQLGEDNPILRKKCDTIQSFTSDIKRLSEALLLLMWEYEGVGLAAPQIGHSVRMIAVTQRDMSKEKWKLTKEQVMINPVIIGKSNETNIDKEACISLPGKTGNVKRFSSITIKFQTIDGNFHIHKAEGYNARIILHEIDHLDGILFVDKLV